MGEPKSFTASPWSVVATNWKEALSGSTRLICPLRDRASILASGRCLGCSSISPRSVSSSSELVKSSIFTSLDLVTRTGKKLGPYEIIAPLGAGGMGEVYRARDTRLNRDVAL